MPRKAEIKPGIYERLITEELNRLLGELDADLVSREPLDPADSHEMLARHVTALVSRALRSVPARSDHRCGSRSGWPTGSSRPSWAPQRTIS